MKNKLSIFLAAFAAVFLSSMFVCAVIPNLIRFQGKITDKSGGPLTGSYNITFRLYNSETGGQLKWNETQSGVPVNNGIFTVLLGNVTALDLPFDEPYWLSMEVNNDGEMTPRQQITSVGYAYRAKVADSVSGASVIPQGAIILWTGASCPQGYSRVTDFDNKFIVSGATYNPAAGGSNKHMHTTAAHTHIFSVTSSPAPRDPNEPAGGGGIVIPLVGHTHQVEGTTNSGGSGNTGEADSRPEFMTILFCRKN